MPVKEWTQECKSCRGTGLYVGFAEKDGAAVVCHSCEGTGAQKMHFEFNEFTGRKSRSDISHVYGFNPGIFVDGKGSVPGGVSIDEWLKDPESINAPGREMRMHTCPAWWYQFADYHRKPGCEKCAIGGAFSKCLHFAQKELCWVDWDKEFATSQK